MSEKERNQELLKIAKTTIMKHGPGYYRDETIIGHKYVAMENADLSTAEKEGNIGRSYYTVKYIHDERVESFHWGYPAKVYIWGDTGVAFMILFGSGPGFGGLDKPMTRSEEEELFKPFYNLPPRQKDSDSQNQN